MRIAAFTENDRMDSDITFSPTSIACSEWSVSRDYYKRFA